MSVTKEDVIQFIENMTVLELSDFIKDLEEKFGVTAAMPVMAAGALLVQWLHATALALRPLARLPMPARDGQPDRPAVRRGCNPAT